MTRTLPALLAVLTFAGPGLASKDRTPARLVVKDEAKLFTDDGIAAAKAALAKAKPDSWAEVHVETYAKLSDADAKKYADAKGNEAKEKEFWKDWTVGHAKENHDRGLVLAVCADPHYVASLPDKHMARHIASDEQAKSRHILMAAVKETDAKARDKHLLELAEYLGDKLPTGPSAVAHHDDGKPAAAAPHEEGVNWTKWLLIGGAVLIGIWIMKALFSAMSGGGGGGPGGGGGGGFFPSLLGGLFGAAAGMWMYDSFFRHDTPSGGGFGGGDAGSSGDGDFSGGDVGGDNGGFSGGDFGGGGGDGDF